MSEWLFISLLIFLVGTNIVLLWQLYRLTHQNHHRITQPLTALQITLTDQLGRLERHLLQDANTLQTTLAAQIQQQNQDLTSKLHQQHLTQQQATTQQQQAVTRALTDYWVELEKTQREALQAQQTTLATTLSSLGQQMQQGLATSAETLGKQVASLTQTTDQRLQEISGQVDQRLQAGFEKTAETFARVLEHISRIDAAQKKITELSENIVSLQMILDDKQARGAFGEVQLQALIGNLMPANSFTLQATLSNGKRVDCLLHLPAPTGPVPIDAKFPLAGYQQLQQLNPTSAAYQQATAQFRRAIRAHIQAVAGKYLIPGETADGAMLFIPAEAVFAEIHAHYPELVIEAQQARVWLVSPTTLMAVLTTAHAVLKDDATREQVHIIQEHLHKLAVDFRRFQQRMDKLATHIRQAHDDVGLIHTSAQKINRHFAKIEAAELDDTVT